MANNNASSALAKEEKYDLEALRENTPHSNTRYNRKVAW
jgi:hypothetical protein